MRGHKSFGILRDGMDADPCGYAPGFSKSATLEEIASYSHVLAHGRYVGSEALEDDGDPFEEKLARLTTTLEDRFAESAWLEGEIRGNYARLGYGS